MGANNLPREGRYLTLRLFEQERNELQGLGRKKGLEDRYTALCEMARIVDELNLEDIRQRTRRPLRIRIPPQLEAAIKRKVKKTGQPFLTVLIEAVKEYDRR